VRAAGRSFEDKATIFELRRWYHVIGGISHDRAVLFVDGVRTLTMSAGAGRFAPNRDVEMAIGNNPAVANDHRPLIGVILYCDYLNCLIIIIIIMVFVYFVSSVYTRKTKNADH
jgi:hypothetical protein